MIRQKILSIAVVLCVPVCMYGQAPAASPAASVWNTLSSPIPDPTKSAHTDNVEIVRDRVHITLTDGTIQFMQPANGVVFGAVFHGAGHVQADPPNAIEGQQLRLFTKQDRLDMTFTEATFSFTGAFAEELDKLVRWQASGPSSDDFYARRQQEREDLGAEYLPRLFKSVFSPDQKRTAYFLADLKTMEKGWVEVRDDAMQPEEIRIGRWGNAGPVKVPDVWMNFPGGGRDPRHVYDDPGTRQDFLIRGYKITTTVAENAELSATAEVTLQPRYSGEKVLLFAIDSNLRVSAVKDSQDQGLEYFQARERKDRHQSYGDYVAVALKDPTQAEQNLQITFQYGGKRVVRKVGDGNYFCESFGWYPVAFTGELGVDAFAFRSDFDMTFRSPKKYSLAATGHMVSETTDGKELVTNWKSDIPLAAAGFVYGDYKITKEKAGDVEVQVYANNQPDDLLKSIQNRFNDPARELGKGPVGSSQMQNQPMAAIGNLTPAALGKTISIETANTLRVFESYFGPYPYRQLVVTNIIGSYGQGWPGLLYLGWFTFLDPTQQHALGIRNQVQLTDFFRGHESSHQWWGHRVGWKSYHDQWLSEGFAEFSGKLYVQYRQGPKDFLEQFRKDKELLRSGDIHSHRIDSLGPIWMGRRILSSETNGSSYQNLIYSKGGYVLQMLRMQLWDGRSADPDHNFKDMMQDYCKTFDNRPASTEDFKAIVEKHMSSSMDAEGNHKMDWFFNQYVYGMGEPQYNFRSSADYSADGKTHLKIELTRTGVPVRWKDVIPLYAHVGDKMIKIGNITVTHPTETIDTTVQGKIDRFSINDYEDILGEVKQ